MLTAPPHTGALHTGGVTHLENKTSHVLGVTVSAAHSGDVNKGWRHTPRCGVVWRLASFYATLMYTPHHLLNAYSFTVSCTSTDLQESDRKTRAANLSVLGES